MSIFGNPDDNQINVESPALDGQGQTETAGGIDTTTTPPEGETQIPEGQGVQEQQETQEPDYKAMYEETKKAYDNLRPAFTRATQELSTYKKRGPAEQPVAQAPRLGTPQEQEVANIITDIVNQAVAPLQQQQAELVMQSEVARFKASTPDFDEQAPAMYKILEEMPDLWNIGDVGTVLDTAYKLAKVNTIEQQIPELVTQAKNGAYETQVLKEMNAGDRTRPNNQVHTQKSPADIIREGILADARKTQGSVF